MTTARELIEAHRYEGGGVCSCGWMTRPGVLCDDWFDAHRAHLADVLDAWRAAELAKTRADERRRTHCGCALCCAHMAPDAVRGEGHRRCSAARAGLAGLDANPAASPSGVQKGSGETT